MKTPVAYVCAACGATHALSTPLWRCPVCHFHLNLAPGPGIGRGDIDRAERSLWRYRRALALASQPLVTLGEGWTPLVERRWRGHDLLWKLEFIAPTGSFKDRGAAVMISYLAQCGVAAVMEDSSGNGGAAVAGYAAAAGMRCKILVPVATSPAKIVQIAAFGAEVVPVAGTRQDVADAAIAESQRIFYASHNWQPFFLEGTKTLGYELWEQSGFAAPDNIIVSMGGGSNILGCQLAFAELKRRGEVTRLPRLFGVQPRQVAPIEAAFASGSDTLPLRQWGATLAEGIAVTRPVRLTEVLAAFRESGGRPVAVGEDEIVAALRDLARIGLFVEPTSAAAAAGYAQLIAAGEIRAGERTIVVLTGSGLKAADAIGRALGL